MRRFAVIALLIVAAPCVNAQRTGATTLHFARTFPGRPSFYPYPVGFFFDSYSNFDREYPAASQPPIVVLQAPTSTAAPQPASTTMQPVLIELEGDRYVRRNAEDTSEVVAVNKPMTQHAAKSAAASSHVVAAGDLAPVVLIFRDGHREDISEYTIADGALYASGDYYANGLWTRKIELSSLNLPDTLKLNESRGVRFQLPTAANEVIVRP